MHRRALIPIAIVLAVLAAAPPAGAFCGFYVARADTKIYNRASQVVIVRDGDRTVLTMANDFRGAPERRSFRAIRASPCAVATVSVADTGALSRTTTPVGVISGPVLDGPPRSAAVFLPAAAFLAAAFRIGRLRACQALRP